MNDIHNIVKAFSLGYFVNKPSQTGHWKQARDHNNHIFSISL